MKAKEPIKYSCTWCQHDKTESEYYKMHFDQHATGKALICRDCINAKYDVVLNTYKSVQLAIQVCCHYLNLPYLANSVESMESSQSRKTGLGTYIRILNNRQNAILTFEDSIINGELSKTDSDIKAQCESAWNKPDEHNKCETIRFVGFDPFESCNFEVEDRRVMFCDFLKYLNLYQVEKGSYRVSGLIDLVKSELQYNKIDNAINQILHRGYNGSNTNNIAEFVKSKQMILDSIEKIKRLNHFDVEGGTYANV